MKKLKLFPVFLAMLLGVLAMISTNEVFELLESYQTHQISEDFFRGELRTKIFQTIIVLSSGMYLLFDRAKRNSDE